MMMLAVLVSAAGCGGNSNCKETKAAGGQFCVPDGGTAPAGQAISLEIFDSCGSACDTSTFTCSVSRDGGTIALSLTGQTCMPGPGTACTLQCVQRKWACDVGALPAGDYTVTVPEQFSKSLRVVEDGGVASCTGAGF